MSSISYMGLILDQNNSALLLHWFAVVNIPPIIEYMFSFEINI